MAVNKLLMVIAAGAALGTAGMASAQYSGQYGYPGQYGGGYGQNSDWNYRNARYAGFERDYRHTIDGIRHGLSDGTYKRSRANEFYRELESIRRAAYLSQQYGNYRHDYIQARMARLHQRMHIRHDRAHERNDRYGQYDPRYGGYQYGYQGNNYGDRDDHHDGDHNDDDDD